MKKANTGFTLIEMLMVIVIAGILAALGVPAFNDMIRNNRLTVQANDLVTAFNLARGEAIKRRVNVTVCTSSDQATCTGGGWQQGWIVFDTASGDILRIFDAMKGDTAVTATATTVTYTPAGFLNGGAAVSLSLCAGAGLTGRQVDITATGRPSNLIPHPTC